MAASSSSRRAPGSPSTTSDRRARQGLTLRDYVLAGCADLVALEAELARARGGDGGEPGRRPGARAPTRPPSSASSTPAARTGGRRRLGPCTASASATRTWIGSSRTFSGGELTRASLARALAGDPDLLLLDEPTNHLDIPSLEWLEGYLTDLDAAVVLVAHDRWFLEAVGTSVLELEAGKARFFAGPWHAWRQEQPPPARSRSARRSTPAGARSSAWSASSSASATRRPRRARRSRGSSRSTRSSATGRARPARHAATLALLASARPSAPAGSCSRSRTRRIEVPGRTLLEDGDLGARARRARRRSSAPTAPARRR